MFSEDLFIIHTEQWPLAASATFFALDPTLTSGWSQGGQLQAVLSLLSNNPFVLLPPPRLEPSSILLWLTKPLSPFLFLPPTHPLGNKKGWGTCQLICLPSKLVIWFQFLYSVCLHIIEEEAKGRSLFLYSKCSVTSLAQEPSSLWSWEPAGSTFIQRNQEEALWKQNCSWHQLAFSDKSLQEQ